MKVSIVRGGGIGGIATRTQLASEELPAPDGRRLEQLASAAALAADTGGGAPAYPDETLYKITVDGVTATHTETTLPEPARALIDFVGRRPERKEGLVQPPGRR